MNSPRVSVLMTAFNREKYIAEAVESVLASSYPDFELIIVDDQSSDATVTIAKRYASSDSRVKVYINDNNIGDYPNRNRAASYASGEFLKYVDSDDYMYPWGLELLVRIMDSYPDAGWGLCSLAQDDMKPYPILFLPSEAYKYHYNGHGIFFKGPLSSIIRRDCFEKVGGFRPIRMAGDFDMWHRLANRFPLILMPDGIVWSRTHDMQETTISRPHAPVYERLKIEHLSSQECPLEKESRVKFIKNQRNRIIQAAIKNLFFFDIPNALIDIKSFKLYNSVNYKELNNSL